MILVRADGETEVDVDYNITGGSAPCLYGDNAHPGDDPEVEITAVYDLSGNPVKWTNEEDEAWCISIIENDDGSAGADDMGDYLLERARDERMEAQHEAW